MGAEREAGDALPEERKEQDDLDRESENAEAQGQEWGAEWWHSHIIWQQQQITIDEVWIIKIEYKITINN